jgi:tetratricopeptide (TPR) repeat protein
LWDKLAQCYAANDEYDVAVEHFKKAIQINPAQVQSYSRLAMVLRQHLSHEKEADEWIQKMVDNNPKSGQAHFLRGAYLEKFAKGEDALQEALLSLKVEPNNSDGLWLASQCYVAKEDYDKAREYGHKSLELYPKNILMYSTLANCEMLAGKPDDAVAVVKKGLEATAQHPQLLWTLANVQLDAKKLDDAEKTIKELRKVEFNRQLIDYLLARQSFAKGNWLAARDGFEKARGMLMQWPELLKQVDVMIAQCYGRLGNRDAQEIAYRRALSVDPFYAPARAGLMEISRATGDIDSAIEEYQRLSKLGKLKDDSLIQFAEMLFTKISREPKAQQNWGPLMEALENAEKTDPNAIQVPVLRAKILMAQERLDDAEKLLEYASGRNPSQSGLWMALASLAERRKDWNKAESILSDAQQRSGDTVAQRLAVAELLFRRHGKKAVDRIRKLGDHADRFAESDQLQLWGGLLNFSMQLDDKEFTKQLIDKVIQKQPNNAQARFLLFEQAMTSKDEAAMKDSLKQIEQISGQGSYWFYGQAVLLMMEAEKKKGKEQDALLDKAMEYLAKARELRPNWSRLFLLTGSILDQQGNADDALKNYLSAIEFGEHDQNTVQRTVQLLFQKQRFNEADQLLRKMGTEKVEFTANMNRASAEAALRQGDFDHALEMARKAVASDSKLFEDYVWLGQILDKIARQARSDGFIAKAQDITVEAERALRRALEISPQAPTVWLAFVQFLNSNDKDDQAENVITEAAKQISAKDASLAIAQCYEIVGKSDVAENKYEAALSASPDEPRVLRAVSDFYCRTGKLASAESLLRKIIDGKVKADKDDVVLARRQMARVYASRGGYRNRQKARELIEKNLAESESSVLDRRAKAGIDALDPDRARRDEAMHEFESLDQDASASPEDRYQLAQMYLAAGAWTQASELFRKLITSSASDPRYLSAYIVALLEHDEASSADSYLTQLEKIHPNHITTASLHAEILAAQNDPDQAVKLLSDFIDKPDARPTDRDLRTRMVADTFERLAQKAAKKDRKTASEQFLQKAESLNRDYVKKNPTMKFLLLAFLGRNGRTDQALDMLQQSWDSTNPAVLSKLCSMILQNDKAGKEQLHRLDTILQSALKQFNRPIPLLMIDADLYVRQARYADAEAYYREVIQKAPANAYAMNNLAVLLALQHIKLDDSLKLINQAVQIAGPMGAMLDSRAVVYLAMGDAEKSLADLADALADSETPVRLFHQAQAYQLAGQSEDARGSLEKATQAGLEAKMLHPLEVPAFEKLKESLK